MRELIERLEKAGAGSRKLDAALWYALVEKPALGEKRDRDMIGRWPAYTTSLDAALALAERVLPGWTWLTRGPDKDSRCPTLCFARLATPDFDCVTWEAGDQWTTDVLAGRDARAHAATPALALCIAILRALRTTEQHSPVEEKD